MPNVPPYIDVCFMPNGKLLLLNTEHEIIKLLNQTFNHEGHLKLPYPYEVAVFDDHTAVVYVSGSGRGGYVLQYIQVTEVTPYLKEGNSYTLGHNECISMKQLDDELYVLDIEEDGFVVRVLDTSGNIKRQINVDKERQEYRVEGFVTVCSGSKRIYVSDSCYATIYCLESDGKAVYQYTDETLEGTTGIYVDSEDNLLVCGENSIDILTAQGTKHATLLSSKDGINAPYSLDYRPSDGTLVVGCYRDKYLHIFKLA